MVCMPQIILRNIMAVYSVKFLSFLKSILMLKSLDSATKALTIIGLAGTSGELLGESLDFLESKWDQIIWVLRQSATCQKDLYDYFKELSYYFFIGLSFLIFNHFFI